MSKDTFVKIGGTAAELVAASNKAVASLEGVYKAASTMAAGAIAFGAAIVGSAVVSGITDMVSSGLDMADAQKEFADKLGVSVQGLSELQYAAKLSDTENEALNAGLTKLGINLANLDEGAGKALKELGLSFDDLKNDDLTTAFKKIVGEIGKIESSAQRSAIAMKLFGKGGVELRGLLSQGADGLEKLIENGHRIHAIIDDIGGAKAAAAKDAIDDLTSAYDGLKMQLAIGLAPAIEATATVLTDFLADADFGSLITDTDTWGMYLAGVADTIAIAYQAMKTLAFAVLAVNSNLINSAATAAEAGAAITGMGKDVAKTLRGLADSSNNSFSDGFADLKNFKLPSTGILATFEKLKQKGWEVGKDGKQAIGQLGEALSDAEKEADKLNKSANDLIEQLKNDVKFHGLDANERKIAEMTEKLKKMEVTVDTTGAQSALDKLELPADHFNQQANDLARTIKGLEDNKKAQEKAKADKDKHEEKLKSDAESLKESIMTPFEAASKKLTEMQEMLDKDLISEEQFGKGVDKLGADLAKDAKPRFAGAVGADSQEARNMLLQHNNPDAQKTKEQEQINILKTIALHTKKAADKKEAAQVTEIVSI